jgi:3'-5' exoribonuclease
VEKQKVTEKELDDIIDFIELTPLRKLMKYIFSPANLRGEFMTAPGATTGNHHSFPGGLAYHVIHATELGHKICRHYQGLGFSVDADLVVAGILLHDIGKIKAYEVKGQDVGGQWQIDKTSHEKLYHHIPYGVIIINNLIDEYNNTVAAIEMGHFVSKDLKDKLLHIILSHHGRKSWSSPVIPQFLEAYIVHIVEFADGMIEKYADGIIPKDIYDH